MTYSHRPKPLSTVSTVSTIPTNKSNTVDTVDIVEGGRPGRARRSKKPAEPVHLQLIGDGSPDKFIGVHAVPNRLPELLRYPGETAAAFCTRALHHVQGTGVVIGYLMYATPPKIRGSSWGYSPTGNAHREVGLFHGVAKGVMP